MTDEEALKEIDRQEKRRVESEKLRICAAGRCPPRRGVPVRQANIR